MPEKPKRLNIRPDDRVIGVRPRTKLDLYPGCNEPGKAWFHPDAHVFMRAFCRICKNADCIRAKGAISPWQTRMAEQVDYLLNEPPFSDMSDPKHLKFAQQAFKDIGQKMLKLDIARERQDWEIPEGPTDGYNKVASPDTTDQFDDAVKELAKARGKDEPALQRPEGTDEPAHFQSEGDEEEAYEYDTQFPSSDGKKHYHVILHKNGRWTCECRGFERWKHCKHLTEVRAWYEDQLRQNEEAEDDEDDDGDSGPSGPAGPATAQAPPPRPVQEPPSPRDPRAPPDPAPYNTPMPKEGVMIQDPETPHEPLRRRPKPRAPRDPWEIPKEKVVEPGATVTLKGTKKKTDE